MFVDVVFRASRSKLLLLRGLQGEGSKGEGYLSFFGAPGGALRNTKEYYRGSSVNYLLWPALSYEFHSSVGTD